MHGKQLRAVQSRSIDVVASVGIVLLACIVASPALDGGLLAVGDNAQHLVEIRELALPNSTGWSDQGFNGFPLNLLQSPLIYGGLAQLARAGLAIEPWYLLLNLASLCAPSLAAFWLVRAYLPLIPALLLGTSLLFYRSTPASLYGMFTFGLAAAAWLVVFTLLLRETRSLRSFAVLALLSACIGLSHVYVTIALVYLGIVHVACNALSGPDGRRKLIWDLPALALGAFSAAAYWMPNILARTPARGQAGR